MTDSGHTTSDELRRAAHEIHERHRRTGEMVRGAAVPYHRRGELVVPAFRMRPGGNPETDGRAESIRVMKKAASLHADMVFFDLEDASPDHPEYKSLGRDCVRAVLATTSFGTRVVGFRPNNIRSPYFEEDVLEVVRDAGHLLHAIVVPKTEHADEVRDIAMLVRRLQESAGRTNTIGLEVLIESPSAYREADRIAALEGVTALAFGAWDFARTIGGNVDAQTWLSDFSTARQSLPIIAAAYGKEAVDAVTATIPARPPVPEGCTTADYAAALAAQPDELDAGRWDPAFIAQLMARRAAMELAARDARDARRIGFAAKWILHPDQIDAVQSAWTPVRQRALEALDLVIRYARAADRGSGAETVGTLMTDRAVAGAEWWVVHAALHAGVLSPGEIASAGFTVDELERRTRGGKHPVSPR